MTGSDSSFPTGHPVTPGPTPDARDRALERAGRWRRGLVRTSVAASLGIAGMLGFAAVHQQPGTSTVVGSTGTTGGTTSGTTSGTGTTASFGDDNGGDDGSGGSGGSTSLLPGLTGSGLGTGSGSSHATTAGS